MNAQRPLLISSDSDLFDDVLRLAAAHAVELHLATDAEGARGRWQIAPLVLVGADASLMIASGRLPRRRDVVLVTRDPTPDTWQNAVFTKEMLNPKPGERWLLVTSATHMPRSVGIVRKIGFDVIPYPVDYQTGSVRGDYAGFRKPGDAIRILQTASHEWIGLVSYYLTGKTSELFPGP